MSQELRPLDSTQMMKEWLLQLADRSEGKITFESAEEAARLLGPYVQKFAEEFASPQGRPTVTELTDNWFARHSSHGAKSGMLYVHGSGAEFYRKIEELIGEIKAWGYGKADVGFAESRQISHALCQHMKSDRVTAKHRVLHKEMIDGFIGKAINMAWPIKTDMPNVSSGADASGLEDRPEEVIQYKTEEGDAYIQDLPGAEFEEHDTSFLLGDEDV